MADRGQISKEDAYLYTALIGTKAIIDTAGIMHPGSIGASLLLGDVIQGYSYYLGISDNPGIIGSLLISIFGEACINRGRVSNPFTTPIYVSSSYLGDNVHVSSRVYRPRGGDYIPEDFSYKFNDEEVYESKNSRIEGSFFFDVKSNLIVPGGINTLVQENTNRNRGNYIIHRDVKVYVPVNDQMEIDLVGDSREDAEKGLDHYNEIQPLKPDFAVFEEGIRLQNEQVIKGEDNEITVNVSNIGTLGAFASFKVLVNDKEIHQEIVKVKGLSTRDFHIPWTPGTEGENEIKIIVDQGLKDFEMSLSNNMATKKVNVFPRDSDGPVITNVFPKEAGYDYSIYFS